MPMLYDVQPKINPRELKDFLSMMLPEVDDNRINIIAKTFFSRFAPPDHLSTPFRRDLFLEAGINLTRYEPEGKGEKVVYHFEFYDLDDPNQRGAFSISAVSDKQILSSKKQFVEFLIAKKTELASKRAWNTGCQ